MPDASVTLGDVYELIAKEHAVTSQKLEALRAEGRERERTSLSALARAEVNIRAYVDDIHQEIKQGVENETTCLQAGLDHLHHSLYGNGDMKNSIAFQIETMKADQKEFNKIVGRWEKIVIVLLTAFGVPLVLFFAGALWFMLTGQWELVVHP